MKLQTIFSCAALTISMASMVVTLPKVSLAHDLLLAQDVQTIIAQVTSVTFTDIAKNPYQTEIIRAQELNIVQGFPDGTFRPNQPVTREQAVSMIVDAIALMTPVDLNATPTSPVRPFLDVPGDRWGAAKINWAQWNLLPAGTPTGRFRPEEPITRADLVSFLRRAAERIKTNLGQPPVIPDPGGDRLHRCVRIQSTVNRTDVGILPGCFPCERKRNKIRSQSTSPSGLHSSGHCPYPELLSRRS